MIGASQVMAWKMAAVFGSGGMVSRAVSHVGDAFKGLDTPHMGKAIEGFGHAANMAAGVGAVAAPLLSAALPSADARIQQKMHDQNRMDRRMPGVATPPGAPTV